jgi:hypothetical protein
MKELENRISRRRMLKRVGAGAAIAWSAPILSSLRTPAFAQYPDRCPETCPTCPPDSCGSDAVGPCFCFPPVDGSQCVCVSPRTCAEAGACDTDADCDESAGERCIFSCCPGGTCGLPCGAPGAPGAGQGPGQAG